jgi:hypothetical protein
LERTQKERLEERRKQQYNLELIRLKNEIELQYIKLKVKKMKKRPKKLLP